MYNLSLTFGRDHAFAPSPFASDPSPQAAGPAMNNGESKMNCRRDPLGPSSWLVQTHPNSSRTSPPGVGKGRGREESLLYFNSIIGI